MRVAAARWRIWCGAAAIYALLHGASAAFFTQIGAALGEPGAYSSALYHGSNALAIALVVAALLTLVSLSGSPLQAALACAATGALAVALLVLWVAAGPEGRSIGTLVYLVVPVVLLALASGRAFVVHRRGAAPEEPER